jgi:predicted membrane protein
MDELKTNRDRRQGLVPGVLMILFGCVILLDHMGYLDANRLWRFWPVILIIVGAVKFFRECNRVVGALMMIAGGVVLLNNLGFAHLSWADLWPFLLITAGATMIWSRMELPRFSPAPASGPNTVNEFALFGNVDRRIGTTSFQGGRASSIFGAIKLDFRTAEIEGEEAVLYLEAVFGGIELIVPDRWNVQFEGQSIFGGYGDETRAPVVDAMGNSPKKHLILRGRSVFGGVVVKN